MFGKEYTDKKEAAKALLKAGMAFTNSNSEQIGAYRGFELHRSYNIASDEIQLEIQGQICYTFPFSKTDWVNLSKLDTVLDKLPEVLKEEQQKLDMLHQQMGDAQKQLSQPFSQGEALREKTKRLEELAAELDIESSEKGKSLSDVVIDNKKDISAMMVEKKVSIIHQSKSARRSQECNRKEDRIM